MTLDWRNVLAVAIGGGLGSVLRYLIGLVTMHWLGPEFPWGTLLINVGGSLAIGLAGELALAHVFGMGSAARLFLMVGVLGGFTTFSAFSLEALGLISGRTPLVGFAYIVASVVLGLVACYVGIVLGRLLIHL